MLLRPPWKYHLAVGPIYGVCLNSMDFEGTKGLSMVYGPVAACRVELFAVVRQCASPPTTSKLGVAQRKSDASTGVRVKRRSYVVLSAERSRSFEVQRQYHLGDVYDS